MLQKEKLFLYQRNTKQQVQSFLNSIIMDSNFASVAQSYQVEGQAPLDAKSMANTIAELINLGEQNVNAYRYYRGMVVFCHETKKHYQWTDVLPVGTVKLLPTNFVYPTGSTYDNTNYSGLSFNFIEFGGVPLNLFQLAQINGYTGTLNQWLLSLVGPPGNTAQVLIDQNANLAIQERIFVFTKQQILTSGGILQHNFNVKRYISETFSYPLKPGGNTNFPLTLSPKELIENNVVDTYSYAENGNSLILTNFQNLEGSFTDIDVILYIVRFTSIDAPNTSFYVPKKRIEITYDSSNSAAVSTYIFTKATLLEGLLNQTPNQMTEIIITQLLFNSEFSNQENGELGLNAMAFQTNKIITFNQMLSGAFKLWINKIDNSGLGGNYIATFRYRAINFLGIQSNEIEFTIAVTDTSNRDLYLGAL
jgi:hypothetical protein